MSVWSLWIVLQCMGCGVQSFFEPPTTKEEIEEELEEEFGEAFRVIAMEELPDANGQFNIMVYRVQPVNNPELEFNLFESVMNRSYMFADYHRVRDYSSDVYGHAVVKKEILDWLAQTDWKYEVEYKSYFVEGDDKELHEKYETNMNVGIYVDDIELEREEIAEDLEPLMQEMLCSVYGEQFTLERSGYSVTIYLKYIDGDTKRQEFMRVFEDSRYDINKEGIIKEFMNLQVNTWEMR